MIISSPGDVLPGSSLVVQAAAKRRAQSEASALGSIRKDSTPTMRVTFLFPCRFSVLMLTVGKDPFLTTTLSPRLMRHCGWQRLKNAARSSALGRCEGNSSPFLIIPLKSASQSVTSSCMLPGSEGQVSCSFWTYANAASPASTAVKRWSRGILRASSTPLSSLPGRNTSSTTSSSEPAVPAVPAGEGDAAASALLAMLDALYGLNSRSSSCPLFTPVMT
mmetsp:Transcript_7314/g.19581  ORF Transcript_7314/g.19581 Transcript_7314/m.19581 type:complete len:220 (-) Transcript_7314:593-1252(-)